MDLSFDIATLLEGYASGSITPSEIVRECIARIEAGDSKIWISVDSKERLLRQARELGKKGPDGFPLYGIPFAVKDNIDVDGLPTTAACPDFQKFAEGDATVVSLLRRAGAIPIGKTNLDQFATGLVGTRSPYGTPENPFNSKLIPGGSSSGSAVATASGQVSFALGTDTAGSGRIPACFNNLIGLKPTRGLLSNSGVVPACRSLDCVSIFSLCAHDAQAVFRIVGQRDPQDPYSRANNQNLDNLHRKGLAFGVPEPTQLHFFGNHAYREHFLKAVSMLEALGYRKHVIDLQPFLGTARLLYEGPWVAERYWAIRELIETAPDALHPITKNIIAKGKEPTALDAFDAFYELQELRAQAERSMDGLAFVVTPTAGTCYRVDQIEQDPIALNSNLGYYTNFMNLLDLSAIAVPSGICQDNTPFGVTLFAPAFHDEFLLQVADQFHAAADLPAGATERKVRHALDEPPASPHAIAVCGAHMEGLPLNAQLTDRGARFLKQTYTSSNYKLFALPNTDPPKPGLVRLPDDGSKIAIELWQLPSEQWASFIAEIPPPLGIGNLELEDGSFCKGFLCESWATAGAEDVSAYGNWRAYLASK